MGDLYEQLGVSREASPAEVRRAYRQRAREAHPDRSGSEAHMKRLNEAYAVLGDAERRRAYDESTAPKLHRAPRRPPRAPAPRPLPVEATQFAFVQWRPLHRLLCLALAGVLADPTPEHAEQALRTLEASASRLARLDWPESLAEVNTHYGRALREVSDALCDMSAGVEGIEALREGMANLYEAIAPVLQ
ncbi:MAG TPA: J domain-containing protein [Oscillatoriaceae cyanobacterium]